VELIADGCTWLIRRGRVHTEYHLLHFGADLHRGSRASPVGMRWMPEEEEGMRGRKGKGKGCGAQAQEGEGAHIRGTCAGPSSCHQRCWVHSHHFSPTLLAEAPVAQLKGSGVYAGLNLPD
jgi:hypothetical protein